MVLSDQYKVECSRSGTYTELVRYSGYMLLLRNICAKQANHPPIKILLGNIR